MKASSLYHAVGEADLHLLQEVRLRDGSDGRKFSEHWPDSRARRLQSPHHQSRIDETAFRIARAGRAKTYPEKAKSADVKWLELDEKKFRYLVNEDAMATEKTAEGIRKFAGDIVKLEKLVASKLS